MIIEIRNLIRLRCHHYILLDLNKNVQFPRQFAI